MNYRERTLAIFARKPVDNVVYQPRIEHWYNVNKAQGTLPDRYEGSSLLDVYKDLNCSIRSYRWFNCCLRFQDEPSVKAETFERDGVHVTRWETPVGSMEMHHEGTGLAWHIKRFPVQNAHDAKVMEYILRGRTVTFDYQTFEKHDALMGEIAAPMVYIPRVNLQRLFIDFMGFEGTIYALHDDKPTIDRLVRAIDETDEQVLDVMCQSPVPLVNYGDNVDHHFLRPETFEEYILPAYQHRSKRLRDAGKFTFAHWDGSIKNLLPYARSTGCDGIEALTPVPQGDITIEEMKEALGNDIILLDGIPMTCFLPHEPLEELQVTTRKIIELFSPNLILGISDEPSPVCDIERVRMVGDILAEYETVPE